MEKRVQIINEFYGDIDEDSRLVNSMRGRLEYATTMKCIHKYVSCGSKVLEIGAGTGRYSIALAKEGYKVTAIELVQHNLDILAQNSGGLENICSCQGDALDLSRFADETFDAVLLFGPLYHLYERADVHQAIDEALRVVKKCGVVLSAFLSVHAILYNNYLNGHLSDGLEMNFNADFTTRHFVEQLFTGYDIQEFEALFDQKAVGHISTVSANGLLEFISNNTAIHFTEEEFERLTAYHMATCETRELLGNASHLLHICRKK